MRRRETSPGALILAAALLGGAAVQAQTVPVRAGDHESFTRLVLRVPDPESWRLESAPDGFDLLGPPGADFDTAEVFGRIPRDRIAALVRRGGGRLGLVVDCDCHGEAFVAPGVGFVVDVADGPPPPGALAPGQPSMAALLPLVPLPLGAQALPVGLGPIGEEPDLLAPLSLRGETDRVARTEAAILDSVSVAASQGLLDLAVPPEGEPSGASAPGLDLAGRPGVAFRTGAEGPEGEGAELGNNGAVCLPDDAFDLAAWAGTGDLGAELSARMAGLVDERDRLDPDSAEALARTYLAFGFGREAGVALDLDGQRSREREILRLMARLIDGEPVPPNALEDQAGCLGPVALWRALARGSIRTTGERERIALTLALRDLPKPARAAVSLRLAGLYLDAGDPAGAQALADFHEGTGTEAALARAEIALNSEEPGSALRELATLAESDVRMTPEAMADLLDLSVEEERPVSQDLLDLSQALRFEHGEGATRRLLLSEARVLVAQARYEEALDLLETERQARPGEDLDAALTDTISALTESLEDAPFLELALSNLPPELPAAAREVAARRLFALGFPAEAWALWRPDVPSAEAPTPSLSAEPGTLSVEDGSPQPEADPSPALPVMAPVDDSAPLATASAATPAVPTPPEPEPVASAPAPVTTAVAPVIDLSSAEPLPGIIPLVAQEPPPSEPPVVAEEAPLAPAPVPEPITLEPLDAAAAPPVDMGLAERRALLAQAEEARARAAALLQGASAAGD